MTPLFYIGATLGHVLALPMPVLAGLDFVAVFAGTANTPIAATVMAIELFGSEIGVYAAVACVVSYLFSGQRASIARNGSTMQSTRSRRPGCVSPISRLCAVRVVRPRPSPCNPERFEKIPSRFYIMTKLIWLRQRRAVKRIVSPMIGFKDFRCACIILTGIEVNERNASHP